MDDDVANKTFGSGYEPMERRDPGYHRMRMDGGRIRK